jgi:hypothetical protein
MVNWQISSEKTVGRHSLEKTVQTTEKVVRIQLESLVQTLPKVKQRGCEEMIHKHGYLALSPLLSIFYLVGNLYPILSITFYFYSSRKTPDTPPYVWTLSTSYKKEDYPTHTSVIGLKIKSGIWIIMVFLSGL